MTLTVSAAFLQPLASKTDQVLVVCKSGNKEAYLLRRKSNSVKNAGIQYLSISNGRLEFVLPNTPDISGNTFKFSRRGYSGGGEYHITFRNGPYSYVIYDKNTVADNRSLPNIK